MRGSCTQGTLLNLTTNADVIAVAGFSFPDAVTYSYTQAVFNNQGGAWNFIGVGFSLTGTVTGTKFANYAQGNTGAASAGYLYTNGVVPKASFPGSVNVAFPATFATDFSITTPFADLPGCSAGTIGALYEVTNSSVNAWGGTADGAGALEVMVRCGASTNYTVIGKL
jgi:hypothetical protein